VLAGRALSYGDDVLPGARAYGEVPFGGSEPKSDATPWDVSTPVTIPDTGFNIAGYIDRLDISGDGKRALVRDYKTGRPPRGDIRLNGGRELQRCLYAFAVKALLGDDVAISASLLYPREPVDLQLDDPEAVLAEITGYLRAAGRVSPAARPCLARIPAATMTTSPSPCRPTPAPPIANAKCRPPRSGWAKSLRSGRRNDEQRVQVLKDDGARRDAISLHDRSILVEAGAGSGKTAVMAGRIAAMLAEGVAPRSIAAVTFTELAASELLSRVREFVADLSAGTIATELRVALPDGLSQAHRDNLAAASAAIDEITCSTIHGFCQRLIKPYPAEPTSTPAPASWIATRPISPSSRLSMAGCANACPAARAASWPRWCCTAPARPWR
jgi:hypothetical protein